MNNEIAKTLNPLFTDLGTYKDQRGSSNNKGQTWRSIPTSIGFYYQRKSQGRNWYGIAAHYYNGGILYMSIPGLSMRNEHVVVSGDVQRSIKSYLNRHVVLNGFIRGQLRFGRDTYWIDYGGRWADLFPYRRLSDLGATFGVNLNVYLPIGFTIYAETSLTKWLFLYSNVFQRDESRYGYYPLKPGNQLDFRVGIGYSFGKKISD